MPQDCRSPLTSFPQDRLRALNAAPVQDRGTQVLYWMQAFRRIRGNFALQRAVAWAEALQKPLLVVETLSASERWASCRQHRFVLEGMADLKGQFARHQVGYYPYVEIQPGQSRSLLVALARASCVLVTDDYPIRRHVDETAAVAEASPVLVEAVDSNGLLPIRLADRTFTAAHSFRRFWQRALPDHLLDSPVRNPFTRRPQQTAANVPPEIARRWPMASAELLAGDATPLARLPIDQRVGGVDTHGGPRAAQACLRRFLTHRLARYEHERNVPDADVSSGLSPYLHHGQISTHEVMQALVEHEHWTPDRLAERPTGSREHWWGMSAAAEAFLDELVTWRELGFNGCLRMPHYDAYETLPDWALTTLAKHARDRRETVYSAAALEAAKTHDPLWNAAQRQLVREGRLHNYLRMLWGKKILQWTESPQQALAVMIDLNNRYALDGNDPNSYSGIFWVLGRYDRAWGPERPVFGTIRYMSSRNTGRKVRLKEYLARYAAEG